MILDNQFFDHVFKSDDVYFGLANKIKSFDKISFLQNSELAVSIDSRTINKNEIFLALKGDKFDGHDFLLQALQNGAIGLIIQKNKIDYLDKFPKNLLENKLIIATDDTYKKLVEMAKYWRNSFDIPVVGITGSVGKTTTKGMIDSILFAANIPHFTSYKNQNNEIGLPLNILKIQKSAKVAVFELGINSVGEMDRLVDILNPTIALITTVAHVHTEGLGNLSSIAREKRKIFKNFNSKNVGIIFGDKDILDEFSYSHPIVRFGFKRKNNIRASKVNLIWDESGNGLIKFVLNIYDEKFPAHLNVDNEILVHNALAAAAIAKVLEVSADAILLGLENFKPVSGRFEKNVLKNNKGIIINDCYNASPESMKKSLLAFNKMKAKGLKIAVLGDMLELGQKEMYWHRQIGRTLCKTPNIDRLILVGIRAKEISLTAPLTLKIDFAADSQEALKILEGMLEENSLVLLKASHGMGFSNIVSGLL